MLLLRVILTVNRILLLGLTIVVKLCVRRVMRGMARILVVWIMLVLRMLWMLGVRRERGGGIVLSIVKTRIVRWTCEEKQCKQKSKT